MTIMLIVVIIVALMFEFINGFHDTANVVATPIATKSLSPYQAIALASLCNFAGAFLSTNVASTISEGLVDAHLVSQLVLITALLSAIGWNLITWRFGIPSSSSHALIGSLIGAVLAVGSVHDVYFSSIVKKVVLPMVSSPILAFFLALMIAVMFARIFHRMHNPRRINRSLREGQVLSCSLLALAHGSNDAQKTMSMITLALFSYGLVDSAGQIPLWVIVLCATTISLGTLSGGMRIIKTLSSRVAKLGPMNGVAAEVSSGFLIILASKIGLPVSTTQAAAGSIMGSGYTGKVGINWPIVRSMATAWIITLPICGTLSYTMYRLLFAWFQ